MKQPLLELTDWFQTPLGQQLSVYIEHHLSRCLPNYYGHHLVQLGLPKQVKWLESSPIRHQHIVTPFARSTGVTVHASLEQLPFETNSIDVVVLPFLFELLPFSEQLLSEVDRIVSKSGFILTIGVNPLSLWGVPRLLPTKHTFPVWNGSLIGPLRVRAAFQSRGFEVEFLRRFYFSPPIKLSKRAESVFEQMGKLLLPYPAGLYVLSTQKRSYLPLRPMYCQHFTELVGV